MEEIRGLATDDVRQHVRDAKEELFKLRYAARAESVENTSKIRATRKRIAQMNTVLREREKTAAKEGSA